MIQQNNINNEDNIILYCNTKSNGFLLDVCLFDKTLKTIDDDTTSDLYNSIIRIGKPLARNIVKQFKDYNTSFIEIKVEVLNKEYEQTRIVIKNCEDNDFYIIKDIEQSVLLGRLSQQLFDKFSGYCKIN